MNRVIINIRHIRYILDSNYIVISMISITPFHEQRDYKYWTYNIYYRFKIYSHVNNFNHALP